MRFITMGSEAFPTLLFIPGLSATAESCYGKVGRYLQEQWHVVLCELAGRYEGSPAFKRLATTSMSGAADTSALR